MDFARIVRNYGSRLPIGIGQVGRSARNEISPRQGLVRMREFTQMELEYFFNPRDQSYPKYGKIKNEKLRFAKEEGHPHEIEIAKAVADGLIANEIMAYFLSKEFIWYQQLGIPADALRFRHMTPEETPHYSNGNFDMEIKFDFGWKETVGNAYRSDFDLSTHMKHSGEDFSIVDNGEKIVPNVVEPSFGLDRTVYAILLHCYREGEDRGWEWFQFPPKIAPYVAGIFPLMNKDGLQEKAMEVYSQLKQCYDVFYDGSGSIGKRYARADEIGTFLNVTVDYDTLKDGTVTIRSRDTTKQVRVKIEDLADAIWKIVNQEIDFEKAGKPVK